MYENSAATRLEPHHVTDPLSDLSLFHYIARVAPVSLLRKHVRAKYEPNEFPSTMRRLYLHSPDECIPEFYRTSSILVSRHKDMADIDVPAFLKLPTASRSENALRFIRFHRSLLESKRVSRRLHHWIDITFGFKLTGEAAVAAKNVPLALSTAVVRQPFTQLFTHAHPPRLVTLRRRRLKIARFMVATSANGGVGDDDDAAGGGGGGGGDGSGVVGDGYNHDSVAGTSGFTASSSMHVYSGGSDLFANTASSDLFTTPPLRSVKKFIVSSTTNIQALLANAASSVTTNDKNTSNMRRSASESELAAYEGGGGGGSGGGGGGNSSSMSTTTKSQSATPADYHYQNHRRTPSPLSSNSGAGMSFVVMNVDGTRKIVNATNSGGFVVVDADADAHERLVDECNSRLRFVVIERTRQACHELLQSIACYAPSFLPPVATPRDADVQAAVCLIADLFLSHPTQPLFTMDAKANNEARLRRLLCRLPLGVSAMCTDVLVEGRRRSTTDLLNDTRLFPAYFKALYNFLVHFQAAADVNDVEQKLQQQLAIANRYAPMLLAAMPPSGVKLLAPFLLRLFEARNSPSTPTQTQTQTQIPTSSLSFPSSSPIRLLLRPLAIALGVDESRRLLLPLVLRSMQRGDVAAASIDVARSVLSLTDANAFCRMYLTRLVELARSTTTPSLSSSPPSIPIVARQTICVLADFMPFILVGRHLIFPLLHEVVFNNNSNNDLSGDCDDGGDGDDHISLLLEVCSRVPDVVVAAHILGPLSVLVKQLAYDLSSSASAEKQRHEQRLLTLLHVVECILPMLDPRIIVNYLLRPPSIYMLLLNPPPSRRVLLHTARVFVSIGVRTGAANCREHLLPYLSQFFQNYGDLYRMEQVVTVMTGSETEGGDGKGDDRSEDQQEAAAGGGNNRPTGVRRNRSNALISPRSTTKARVVPCAPAIGDDELLHLIYSPAMALALHEPFVQLIGRDNVEVEYDEEVLAILDALVEDESMKEREEHREKLIFGGKYRSRHASLVSSLRRIEGPAWLERLTDERDWQANDVHKTLAMAAASNWDIRNGPMVIFVWNDGNAPSSASPAAASAAAGSSMSGASQHQKQQQQQQQQQGKKQQQLQEQMAQHKQLAGHHHHHHQHHQQQHHQQDQQKHQQQQGQQKQQQEQQQQQQKSSPRAPTPPPLPSRSEKFTSSLSLSFLSPFQTLSAAATSPSSLSSSSSPSSLQTTPSFSPSLYVNESNSLLITGGRDGLTRLWHLSSLRSSSAAPLLTYSLSPAAGHVHYVHLRPPPYDHHAIACASSSMHLWDIERGALVRLYASSTLMVGAAHESKHQHHLYTITIDSQLCAIDLRARGIAARWALPSALAQPSALAFNADDWGLLVGGTSGHLCLLDRRTAIPLISFQSHSTAIHKLIECNALIGQRRLVLSLPSVSAQVGASTTTTTMTTTTTAAATTISGDSSVAFDDSTSLAIAASSASSSSMSASQMNSTSTFDMNYMQQQQQLLQRQKHDVIGGMGGGGDDVGGVAAAAAAASSSSSSNRHTLLKLWDINSNTIDGINDGLIEVYRANDSVLDAAAVGERLALAGASNSFALVDVQGDELHRQRLHSSSTMIMQERSVIEHRIAMEPIGYGEGMGERRAAAVTGGGGARLALLPSSQMAVISNARGQLYLLR